VDSPTIFKAQYVNEGSSATGLPWCVGWVGRYSYPHMVWRGTELVCSGWIIWMGLHCMIDEWCFFWMLVFIEGCTHWVWENSPPLLFYFQVMLSFGLFWKCICIYHAYMICKIGTIDEGKCNTSNPAQTLWLNSACHIEVF